MARLKILTSAIGPRLKAKTKETLYGPRKGKKPAGRIDTTRGTGG